MILGDTTAHPSLLPGIWVATVPAIVIAGMLACAMDKRYPFWPVLTVAAAQVVVGLVLPAAGLLAWWSLRRAR